MAARDPFPADIETWLSEPIQHLYEATIIPATGTPFPVDVVDRLDLTFDMGWTPFVQLALTIWTPEDAAQVAALDGRTGSKVTVRMGYRWYGIDYWGNPVTLRLQSAQEPTPGARTDLTAHGAEMIPQDQGALKEGETATDGYTDRSGVDPFIRSWINRNYEPGPKPAIVSTIPGGAWNVGLVADYKHGGGSCWSAIEGVAQAAGIRVYDDGTGTWHIDYLPGLDPWEYAATLKTGPGGTITSADNSLDRSRWYNQVFLQYDYTTATGTPNTVSGFARVSSGPLAAGGSKTKEYREQYSGQIVTSGYANARAQNLLRKFMLRGHQFSLTAAAAYWLRPGMTITAAIRGKPAAPFLVSAVTFSPLTGSMAVRTTRPEDYEIGT